MKGKNTNKLISILLSIFVIVAMIPMAAFGAGTDDTPEDDAYRIVALDGYNLHFGLWEVLIGESLQDDPYGKATPGYAYIGDTYRYQLKIDGKYQDNNVTWDLDQSSTDVVTYASGALNNNILTYTAAKTGTVTIYAKYNGTRVRKAVINVSQDVGSGYCGKNGSKSVQWKYDKNRKLTISGTGEMEDYSNNGAPWSQYRGHILEVEIKSGVTSIGNHAFNFMYDLNKVAVASSVNRVGNYAFYGCRWDLKSIKMIGVKTIGNHAFDRCYNLKSISIPDTVEYIGSYAFAYCRAITNFTVPKNVTKLNNGTFRSCYNLQKVVIPNGVLHIGNYVFRWCSNLKEVFIDKTSVGTMGNGVFQGCESLTSFEMPMYVATPGKSMFSGCSKLESVLLSDRVQNIRNNTFSNCKKLKNIVIPNSVKNIGNSAFSGCSNLEKVTFGNSVKYLYSYAFSNCWSLKNIQLPNSLISIGSYAFEDCSGLEKIDLGNNLKTIDYYAFRNCTGLRELNIPNSVKTIGNQAFYNCYSLKKITCGSFIPYRYDYVFNGCWNVESIILNDNISSIEQNAFNFADNLKQIYIPKNTTLPKKNYNTYYQIMPHNNDLIIKGYTSSDAQEYANQFDITFIPIDGSKTAISTCVADSIPNYEETGEPITPDVVLVDSKGWELQEGIDYTVSYSNNTTPGTAAITVTGTGTEYTGTKTINFTIEAKPQEVDPPEDNPQGGGGSGGGGGGGTPNEEPQNGDAIVKVDVPKSSMTENNGSVSTEVDAKTVIDSIGDNTTEVKINAESSNKEVLSTHVTIPAEVINKIDSVGAKLELKTSNGEITLDKDSIASISGKTNLNSITVNIEKTKNGPTYANYDVTILLNGTKKVTSFNNGTIEITVDIPEKVELNKGTKVLYKDGVYYYDMGGTVDFNNKKITFETNHLSTYMVAGLKIANKKLISSVKKSKTKSLKLKAQKKKVSLSWKKGAGNKPTTYLVFRSLKKNSGYKKIAQVQNNLKYIDKKSLKKGKKYYYKVRGMLNIDGTKAYTKFTPVMSVKCK